MSNLEGNPFGWGFIENREIETLAQRANAEYNEPMEVNEQCSNLESFFNEQFGHSPNPAHIVEVSKIEPEPYLTLSEENDDSDDSSNYSDSESDETSDGCSSDSEN